MCPPPTISQAPRLSIKIVLGKRMCLTLSLFLAHDSRLLLLSALEFGTGLLDPMIRMLGA